MSFIDDIQGQNTQLYPIVEIDGIWYSTNNVTVKDLVIGTNLSPTTISRYCKPILMNIPSIKESVDVESRRFKISNVSLQFNNFLFDGVRFSDQLSETSLINTKATIYFKSPSTEYVHDMHEVYRGIIRRISHDDTKCSVQLEDLTEQKAHKDLPQKEDRNGVVGYLGDGDSIPDKYKNKPIPMVYGHVDRSPIVLKEIYNSSEAEYISDYRDILTLVQGEELFIAEDNNYFRVLANSQNHSRWGYSDSLQYSIVNDDTIIVASIESEASSLSEDSVEVEFLNNPQKIKLYTDEDGYSYDPSGEIEDFSKTYDALDFEDEVEILNKREGNVITTKGYEIAYTFNDVSNPSVEDFLVKIYWKASFLYSSSTLSEDLSLNQLQCNLIGAIPDNFFRVEIFDVLDGGGVNGNDILLSADTSFTDTWASHFNPRWKITTFVGTGVGGTADGTNQSVMAKHTFDKFYATVNYLFKGFSTKDLYANVKGRINTFDDHPDDSVKFQGYSDDELIQYLLDNWDDIVETLDSENLVNSLLSLLNEYSANTLSTLEENELIAYTRLALGLETNISRYIHNPIDIIYDLVRRELGHDAIDEVEYAEAKAAHDGWKFGFTVNKKINSKKLIEEIAKSTKCFPKFKNDGTFGFNTIKDSYTVSDIVDGDERGDYNTSHLIKESEVISYSFKKTKPEQIYKKVTVSYNKDYAQDSYLKTALSEDLGADPYYGIENSADAHLEFESDYIRHDSSNGAEQTADKLATFLSEQYRNDHLLFNLKLPLQYIDLEIGDLIKFRDLFQGVNAYGIDYRLIGGLGTKVDDSYSQYAYPLFMVTATTKNLDSVSIECMQLHHLSGDDIDSAWYDGTDDGDTEGEFYFPDADTIVIAQPEPVEEDSVERVYTKSAFIDYTPNDVAAGHQTINLTAGGGLSLNQDSLEGTGDFPYNFPDLPSELYEEGFFEENAQIKASLYADETIYTTFRVISVLNNYELVVSIDGQPDWWTETANIVIERIDTTDAYQLGDVNLDFQVNILDIVGLVNYILTSYQGESSPHHLTELQQELADYNQEGNINILDIVGIINSILGTD